MHSRWQPSAALLTLKERAQLLSEIRTFFANRGVLEVDTPLLCRFPATAAHLHSFTVTCAPDEIRYLQTSPEYAMKRIIAAFGVPIYYLGKAFRAQEIGSRHNPEFTMLEWYRPHWDHFQLMEETDELLQCLLGSPPAHRTTYAQLFADYFHLNPHVAEIAQLKAAAQTQGWIDGNNPPLLDKDGWLDLLFTHGIEPNLGWNAPLIVREFPASQASLAKTSVVNSQIPYEIAERFEVYYQGLELANGYHELACPKEQRARFLQDLQKRQMIGLADLPLDEDLLAALEAGFPPCAGIALGFDRLLMLKLGEKDIRRILPLSWERA